MCGNRNTQILNNKNVWLKKTHKFWINKYEKIINILYNGVSIIYADIAQNSLEEEDFIESFTNRNDNVKFVIADKNNRKKAYSYLDFSFEYQSKNTFQAETVQIRNMMILTIANNLSLTRKLLIKVHLNQ